MILKFSFLFFILFAGTSGFCQKRNLADSLKCTQYFDSLANKQIYRFPEKDAEFKGGPEGFSEYFGRNLSYDNSQIKRQETLFFTFIVESDGAVSNVTLKYPSQGVPEEIIEKIIKLFKKSPKLTPAACSGQKVATRHIQPITLFPD